MSLRYRFYLFTLTVASSRVIGLKVSLLYWVFHSFWLRLAVVNRSWSSKGRCTTGVLFICGPQSVSMLWSPIGRSANECFIELGSIMRVIQIVSHMELPLFPRFILHGCVKCCSHILLSLCLLHLALHIKWMGLRGQWIKFLFDTFLKPGPFYFYSKILYNMHETP